MLELETHIWFCIVLGSFVVGLIAGFTLRGRVMVRWLRRMNKKLDTIVLEVSEPKNVEVLDATKYES